MPEIARKRPESNATMCDLGRENHPLQNQILAALWALRKALNAWGEFEGDGHEANCNCEFCVTAYCLDHNIKLAESCLTGELMDVPTPDLHIFLLMGWMRREAQARGLIEADEPTAPGVQESQAAAAIPAPAPTVRRKRWYFEFGTTTGDAS